MTFASNENTEARRLEEWGRNSAYAIIEGPGSKLSRLKYFRAGLNEILVREGFPTLEVVTQKQPKPSIWFKIKFHFNRFLYKRGWKK